MIRPENDRIDEAITDTTERFYADPVASEMIISKRDWCTLVACARVAKSAPPDMPNVDSMTGDGRR